MEKHIRGPWDQFDLSPIQSFLYKVKIHVTATLDNAQSILDAVCSYCLMTDLRSSTSLFSKALSDQNWKYANRSEAVNS